MLPPGALRSRARRGALAGVVLTALGTMMGGAPAPPASEPGGSTAERGADALVPKAPGAEPHADAARPEEPKAETVGVDPPATGSTPSLDSLEAMTRRMRAAPPGLFPSSDADDLADQVLAELESGIDTPRDAERVLASYLSSVIASAGPGEGEERRRRLDEVIARIEALPMVAPAASGAVTARAIALRAFGEQILSTARSAAEGNDYERLSRVAGLLEALRTKPLSAPVDMATAADAALEQLDRLRTDIYGNAETKPLQLGIERFRIYPKEGHVELLVWLRRDEPAQTEPLLVHASAIRLVTSEGNVDADMSALGGPGDFREALLAPTGEIHGRIVYPLGEIPLTGLRYMAYSPPEGRKPVQRTLPRVNRTTVAAGYLERALKELAAPLGSAGRAARDIDAATELDPRVPGLKAAREALEGRRAGTDRE